MKTFVKSSFTLLIVLLLLVVCITSCKEKTKTSPAQETGTVTDVDNTVYKTVKIGNQWWMAEDLNVKKYRNGDYINQIQTDTALWSHDTSGAYCDNKDNGGNLIGRFYNWYAVANSKNIAPSGWHIPSDEEWKTLEKYLGMISIDANKTGWRGTGEGDQLKLKAPEGWSIYDKVWGTNESGFSAVANGCRLFNGANGDPGQFATGFWWSVSDNNLSEAWYRYLDYKNSNVFRSHTFKNYGFCIRCVKD